jgi:hypothetical protein
MMAAAREIINRVFIGGRLAGLFGFVMWHKRASKWLAPPVIGGWR